MSMTTQPPAFQPDFDKVRAEHPALADLSDAEIVELVSHLSGVLAATITECRAIGRGLSNPNRKAA